MWARIEGNTVAEITPLDPAGRFHSSLVWVECPDTVRDGWMYAKGKFSAEPPPSIEMLGIVERAWRDGEVIRVSWLRDRHRDQTDAGLETTLTAEQFGEVLAYIQALRDWPQSIEFPDSSARPKPPEWVAGQVQ